MSNVADNKSVVSDAYWDRHNIPRITLSELGEQIEMALETNQTRGVICAISEAGYGKSQITHQLARKHGYRVVDIRTAQFSLIGAGVPQRADEETGMFKIAVPDDYPKQGEKCMVVFDEINQGQPHAIAMFFKLLEDRGMYNYTLPDDCLIVALMNPSTAGYNVSKIEGNPAINRRLKKFYVYSEFSSWKKHAQSKEFHHSDGKELPCHPSVLKFLNTDPKMLYTDKDRDSHKQFCCPATWQTVSLDLYNAEQLKKPLTSDFMENRIGSSINMTNAKALVEYIKNHEIRISPEEVLKEYKVKSKLRERILELRDEPGGDYVKLVETTASYLFDDKPKPAACASQLLLFWIDMPLETQQAFYQMMQNVAIPNGNAVPENVRYMQDLTTEFDKDPRWEKHNEELRKHHDDFEKKLTKGGDNDETPDPKDD